MAKMAWMSRFRRLRPLSIGLMVLAFLGEAACSRPDGLNTTESATSADPHQVPFHDGNESQQQSSNAAVPSTAQKQNKSQKVEADLPFRDPLRDSPSLPAGTLLTVRLKSPVSADNPDATATFEAIVEEPVIIEGNMMVPRGAGVAGHVESARAAPAKRNGYVRLSLTSLDIAGKDLHLQTSSLYARGNAAGSDASLGLITLEKGRRLTFRLTEPVYLAVEQSPPPR
jgi:hypothetical protein